MSSSVAPLTPAEVPASPASEQTLESPRDFRPRDFHFAVTWVTLFAHLDLIESTGPRPWETVSPALALVPVVVAPAPLMEQAARYDSNAASENAAWEMVVPKMIRTGSGEFTPVKGSEPAS